MSLAPTPGVGARAEAAAQATQIITIRVKDREYTLAPGNLPVREKLAVRQATGSPVEAFISDDDHVGEDSIAILVWLARRANGEAGLAWRDFETEWDALDLGEGDVEISAPTAADDKAEDPEA